MSVANTLVSGVPIAPSITSQYAGGGSGAGVSSLQSLTGAINIVGAGGISVSTTAPSTITLTGGGPGPGLFLPLAGGNMDASPAGVIGAHTITGLTTLESDNAGNDLSILTQAGGADISIDATASGGSLFVDAFSTDITTGTGAGAKVDIKGKVVVQPPGGFTYPDINEVAVRVENWTNPTNNNQFGIVVDNIATAGFGNVAGITSSAIAANGSGDATGIRTFTISATGPGNAQGLIVDNIAAQNGLTNGVSVTNLNGVADVNGIAGGSFISGTSSASGINLSDIQGVTTATGINLASIQSQSAAFGVQLNTITGTGQATGVDIQNVISDNQVVGIQATALTSANNCYGILLNNMSGPANCVGAQINGVDAASNPGSGAVGKGMEVAGINADGETIGIDVFKVLGNNTAPVIGIRVVDVRGVDNVGAIGGNDVRGMFIGGINDAIGNGPSTGVYIEKIYNPNNNSKSKGIYINDVNNEDVDGLHMENISAQVDARGINVINVNAKGNATGAFINAVFADQIEAKGIEIIDVAANLVNSYGINIRKIITPDTAYGIKVDEVFGVARTYGVYIGPNISSTGGTTLGFVQEGSPSQKVINGFDGEVRVGNQEDPNTGISLKVNGSAHYTAQYLNGPGTIVENGGNLVILADTGSSYAVQFGPVDKEGQQFTICMASTQSISLSAASGANINGVSVFTIPASVAPGPPPFDYKMYQAFYTIASGTGEWYFG
jgi:hypothetical protein